MTGGTSSRRAEVVRRISCLVDQRVGWRPWIDLEQAGLAEQGRDGNAHPLVDQRWYRDVGQVEFPDGRRIEQANLGQGQSQGGCGPDGGSTGRPGSQVEAARGVEGQNRSGLVVSPGNELCGGAGRVASQAVADQGVDDQ